ncbi:WEB family protein At1g12150-like [Cicer arietinum]|uniref:WEB family protein At1g12150-like n=1 Tax=Cicer arietinum TaxID=3827 RepID=A0A1S2YNP5_CICAR|nr:WEB family protein At1g12150-like [Cicer arietinum]XP_004507586.1 WEB family protein At1g12150-like [Cicer arietinum]
MKNLRKVDSPRGEVGEIDTRAPFQSVKAAVSLFGEVAVSKDRLAVKRRSSENVFEKETQLILAQKELNKLKKHVVSAETTKAKALSDLEKAKETLENLTTKLNNVRDSKQSAIEAAEAVKNQGKPFEKTLSLKAIGYEAWKQELEHARNKYTTTVTELDSSKQELTKIRQDFDAVLEAKLAAFQATGEAQRSAKLNSERISELSEEIATMKASIEQLKLASAQNENQFDFYKTAKEEAQKKLEALKNEYDNPELIQSLDAKLAETSAEIEALQEQMKKLHASKMDSVRLLTSELKEATKTLQDVAAEEISLKKLVFSLRTELKQVKKEQDELKDKKQEAEDIATNLTGELQESMEEARPRTGTVEDLEANIFYVQSYKIQKLQSEAEDARQEAEEVSRKAQELKQEAEESRAVAEEAEKKLELVLQEAKEAKAAEQRAIKEMKILSFSGKIKMSNEEFELLNGKVKEFQDLAEQKEAAVIAELQAMFTRKNELDRKVEANLKAIEETKAAMETALWYAVMADSAKIVMERELKSCRQPDSPSSRMSNSSDNSSILSI